MKKELWLIWKEPISRRRYVVGTLIKHDHNYNFRYNYTKKEFEKINFDFFPGFNNVGGIYNSNVMFDSILSRLPNKNRPDYLNILKAYGLNEENTEMEILEKTKGRLWTDSFEFVPAFDENNVEFEIAGISHCPEFKKCKDKLKIGDELLLKHEKNDYDKNAVIILYENYKIGYVPRYYSEQINKILNDNVEYKAFILDLKIESKIEDELISVKFEIKR